MARLICNMYIIRGYNPFLVYCRELAPGTVSLTRGRAQGDDSKHDSHYNCIVLLAHSGDIMRADLVNLQHF